MPTLPLEARVKEVPQYLSQVDHRLDSLKEKASAGNNAGACRGAGQAKFCSRHASVSARHPTAVQVPDCPRGGREGLGPGLAGHDYEPALALGAESLREARA